MNRTSALILILLSIGIFYTFTTRQYGDAQALADQAKEYRNVIDNAQKIAEARDNLLTSYESIPATEKDRLAKALPSNIDTVEIARDLDGIAGGYGITLKNIQVDTKSSNGQIVLPDYQAPYNKVTISFTFVASYQSFVKFMEDLEKNLRIMDVKSVHFEVGENNLYEHTVVVETYWLK